MKYLIWNQPRGQFFKPNSMGYTPCLEQAGRYTGEQIKEAKLIHSYSGYEKVSFDTIGKTDLSRKKNWVVKEDDNKAIEYLQTKAAGDTRNLLIL